MREIFLANQTSFVLMCVSLCRRRHHRRPNNNLLVVRISNKEEIRRAAGQRLRDALELAFGTQLRRRATIATAIRARHRARTRIDGWLRA